MALARPKRTRLFVSVVIGVVMVIGLGGTFGIGRQVKTNAIDSWERQAEQDVAIATVAVEAWVAQADSILRGIAVAFRSPEPVSNDGFLDLAFDAEEWNSEFSLNAVAFARRVVRKQRAAVESELGGPFAVFGDPSTRAPEAYESFVVEYSSDEAGSFTPRIDLITNPSTAVVVSTAFRVPNQIIMGPAYDGPDGLLFSLAALRVRNGGEDGVLVGEIDLSELIAHVEATQVPKGIRLRLAERDNESRATSLLRPVYGTLEPASDVLYTVTVRTTRGQARWDFNWDILPDYLGGPPTAIAVTIQVGGLVLTVLVITTIGFLASQNTTIRKKVKERTASLLKMKEEAELANHAKSNFLSSVSHEFRTPMTAILGFGDLLKKDATEPLSKTQEEHLDHVLRSAKSLLDLIDQILGLNKIETGQMPLMVRSVDPAAVVNTSLALVSEDAKERKIKIINRTSKAELPKLWVDSQLLEQVLVNLLTNAVKYNRAGGTVTLSAEQRDDGMLRIAVADTGEGIPEDKREWLFQAFNRLGRESGTIEGTGIGLVICKNIAEMLGARMGFESVVGEGSTFWVDVCLKNGQASDLDKAATTKTIARKITDGLDATPRLILYIDNSPESLELMKNVTDLLPDVSLITASDAELGVYLAREYKPDLIMLDINMPGMNETEALANLTEDVVERDTPVIAMSAIAMREDVGKTLKAGFDAYVTKPYNVTEIQSLIREYI
jgi:signal transduction histidine kinase/CheY-like chemotaxis protein